MYASKDSMGWREWKIFNFNPQLNKALPASTCMFMHGQLPCLANKQHICGSLVYSSTKTRGQKRKKQKKNMSLSMWLIIGICIWAASWKGGSFLCIYRQVLFLTCPHNACRIADTGMQPCKLLLKYRRCNNELVLCACNKNEYIYASASKCFFLRLLQYHTTM
jgi:hypothetical protein